jgi:hypothetical protein
VAKEYEAVALIRNSELGPKGWQDVFVQPDASLRYKVGSFRDREKGTRSSVARAIDGYEWDTVCVTRNGCGMFRISIKVMAFITTTMEAYNQRPILDGRFGVWRNVVNARHCSSVRERKCERFHSTEYAEEIEAGEITVRYIVKVARVGYVQIFILEIFNLKLNNSPQHYGIVLVGFLDKRGTV